MILPDDAAKDRNPEQYREALIAEAEKRGHSVPPELRAWALRKEAMRRGLLIHPTFRSFVESEHQSLLQFEHIPKLISVADRVVAGELRYVMILAPPRYLKSEVFSRLLPAYYLLKFPRRMFSLACHAASLSLELSEAARENFVNAGGTLAAETAAKARWQVAGKGRSSMQGTMWAVGVHGGGALGRGFNLGVVDDPLHPDHAYSWMRRQHFKRWWENTWLRSLEPGAQMIFVMQRLHVEDPVDYLFRREVGEGEEVKAPLHWHVVVMDEIKSSEPLGRWKGPRGLPSTCTVEPDERKEGAVLAPSRFSAEEVKERQAQNPVITSAQRQQRPLRPSGDFWRLDWFETYETLPRDAYDGGWDWDTAQTKEERNSASAYVRSFRGPALNEAKNVFNIYIEDVGFAWVEYPELIAWMKSYPGPHHIEAKSSGKSAAQSLKTYGISVSEVTVLGDKLARASAAQPAVAARRIYVKQGVVQKLLYAEQQGLLRITAEGLQMGGEGLDLNDAFVQALHRHLGIGAKGKATLAFR